MSYKSPVASAGEKKSFKTASYAQNSSNSKRKKEDKENIEPKGIKKKSKKLFLQTPPEWFLILVYLSDNPKERLKKIIMMVTY